MIIHMGVPSRPRAALRAARAAGWRAVYGTSRWARFPTVYF